MIRCSVLSKNYRSYKKQPGFIGSLKSIFVREAITVPAVQDFNLEIARGEIVGLLGPNGAGKTTLIKMLSGIIAPSSGVVNVLGYEPFKRPIGFRRKIALVMGQKSQLWWDIPAMDSFLLLQRYYEIDERKFKERLETLGRLLSVNHLFEIHIRKLSLGERMKMELMACLLHDPDLLFLDEPTIGLDVVAQKQIRDFFKEYQQRHNTTIILTSHYMADVDALCPRVVLILGGKKRFDSTIRDFERILGREKFVTLTFSGPVEQGHGIWRDLRPQWSPDGTCVELQIAEDRLRDTSAKILMEFPVVDYATEKLPIERVMKSLITNPQLIPEQ